MTKKLFTVNYSISGIYSIDVMAKDVDDAISIAENALEKIDWNEMPFELEEFQVIDENGDVVWGIS